MGTRTKQTINLSSLLNSLTDQFNLTNSKLDIIIDLNRRLLIELQTNGQRPIFEKEKTSKEKNQPDAMTLISLPASLRKTVMTLYQLEKATATELAKETKRLRAVESAAANQLVRLGYVKKKRKGRDIYFYLDQPDSTEEEK